MVKINRPPSRRSKGKAPAPKFHIIPAGTKLLRIFDPTRFTSDPIEMRHFGPVARFDHHVGIGRGMTREPAHDPDRGILYAAFTLSCCVVEVFGDFRNIVAGEYCVAEFEISRDLRMLDLIDGAMAAGTVAAISATERHERAQEWSRRFHSTPTYRDPDGILYRGAHNGEVCLALYERTSSALRFSPGNMLRLDHPTLRDPLLEIASDHEMILA